MHRILILSLSVKCRGVLFGQVPAQFVVWDCNCGGGGGGSLTVCAAADRGVLWTGVRRWLRLSHRTICPEYVPPTTRLGWNLAKPTDTTGDWANSQREKRRGWDSRNTTHINLVWGYFVGKIMKKIESRRSNMVTIGMLRSDEMWR